MLVHGTIGAACRRAWLTLVVVLLVTMLSLSSACRETAAESSSGVARLFSADSPFNTTIPSTAAIDGNSTAMIGALLNDAKRKGAKITWAGWSVPVYWADGTTPRYSVALNQLNFGGYQYLDGVPIPDQAASAAPDTCQSGTDGHMTIIDKSNNCMYDFWRACKKSDGSWVAGWANRMYGTDTGIYPQGASTRGSGFANVAGLMTPAEFQAGAINHALMFSSGANRSGGPVAPATESDGGNSGTQYIPEGARIRLKASFDLSSYPKYLQVIGQALKTYGAFNGDNSGGGFNLYAVDANRSDAPWRGTYPWGTNAYPSIPVEFLQNMEVITLGPQTASQYNPVPQSCASYR